MGTKGGANTIYFYFNIHGKLSLIRFIHDFSVWLRIGSNPADINRFRSHNGIIVLKYSLIYFWWKINTFLLFQVVDVTYLTSWPWERKNTKISTLILITAYKQANCIHPSIILFIQSITNQVSTLHCPQSTFKYWNLSISDIPHWKADSPPRRVV